MNILVTGGLGYIGSHTIIELSHEFSSIHILDNLSNSSETTFITLQHLLPSTSLIFHKGDIQDFSFLSSLFTSYPFDTVFHFAALKSINESNHFPLAYYQTNVIGTINLLKAMQKNGVKKLVFSSSACVYGNKCGKYSEDDKIDPCNVYGTTKVIGEQMIRDWCKANLGVGAVILRYFNPIGAHFSGLIGEESNGATSNLVPSIQKVVMKKMDVLKVFGADYETDDGTAVRDYVHVEDLAKGHVLAFKSIKEGVEVYNLGTGKGVSVLQVVKCYEKVSGERILYEVVGRREGDVGFLVADNRKMSKLGWKAEKSLEDMCRDSWKFITNKAFA